LPLVEAALSSPDGAVRVLDSQRILFEDRDSQAIAKGGRKRQSVKALRLA